MDFPGNGKREGIGGRELDGQGLLTVPGLRFRRYFGGPTESAGSDIDMERTSRRQSQLSLTRYGTEGSLEGLARDSRLSGE